MNISPVSMFNNSMSFKCAYCDEASKKPEAELPKEETSKEDKIVGYSLWGGDYVYPIYESQVKEYQENAKRSQEAIENRSAANQLEGETLEEYLERHKLEWSM